MKKSSPSALPRVTRITPSAPTPRCRSQSAATSAGTSGRSSSRSSSMTKSLPVPWYFQILSSPIRSAFQVPRDVLDDGDGAGRTRREPPDPRVPAEEGHLTTRERLRPPHRARDRLVERPLSGEMAGEFSVPDGLGRGEPSPEPTVHQRPDLVQETALEHLGHACLDAGRQDRSRHLDPGGADPIG